MILEIEGVGRVEVDDTFKALSPEEQDRTVQEIVGQAKRVPEAPAEAPADRASGFLPHLNKGIASVLGAPADALHAIGRPLANAVGLETTDSPPLGERSIQGGMEAIGIPIPQDSPDTFAEHAGSGIGQAAGALVPFVGGARLAAGAAKPMVSGIGQAISRPFVATPGRAAAAELAAGGGFEVGQAAAEEQDASPLGQFAGGLLGSLGAAVAPSMALRAAGKAASYTPAGWLLGRVRAAVFPFTEAGGKVRASRRLQELSADPAAAAAALDEPSVGNLTPAQQTGEPRIMALERAILDKDARLDADFKQRTAESSSALKEALREPAGGRGPEEVQQFVGERLNYLTSLLDQRVVQAGESVAQRLAKLTPENRASQNSQIVRAEMEAALRAARTQERQLWQAIPDDAPVPTAQARAAYEKFLSDLPRAQQDALPEKARRFLDPLSNERLQPTDAFKEVRGLYSEMREASRLARSAGKFNEARVSDGIADAILEDMGSVAGEDSVGRLYQDARGFSRALNERFRQGDIGRILGYEREGGARVAAETTLDITIGRGGTKAAVSADELRQAIAPIEGQAGAPDPQAAEVAMRDYLRRRFTDYSVRNGEMDANRAQDFVRKNDEVLDRFPDLKQEMVEGEAAQVQASRQTRTAGERANRLRDPKRSKTAAVLNADPEKVIDTVIKSRAPREAARDLRRQTGKDDTGEALAGLKGSFFDYLTRQAKTSAIDEAGEPVLSGRAFHRLLNEPRVRAAATEILTQDEFKRLQRITQEFRKLETSQGRLPDVGAPMTDAPNQIIGYVTRVMAARMGARAGAGTSGASLLTAHLASKRMRDLLGALTNDRAEALLSDAIQDKDLFQTLLLGVDSPRNAKRVERRLVEWLAGYTAAQAGDANAESQLERAPTPQ